LLKLYTDWNVKHHVLSPCQHHPSSSPTAAANQGAEGAFNPLEISQKCFKLLKIQSRCLELPRSCSTTAETFRLQEILSTDPTPSHCGSTPASCWLVRV